MSAKIYPVTKTDLQCENYEVYINGEHTELPAENIVSENYTDNSNFSQLEKNSVDSEKQLKETDLVKFENSDGNGNRVLFVGNSMTLHGIKPEIGWNKLCGMAASSKEKDYVHRLISLIDSEIDDCAYCICQVAEWERNYKKGSETFELFKNARDFEADIIVMRFIENCPVRNFEDDVFISELGKLLNYLNKKGKAKIVLTTGFWRHPGDSAIIKFANKKQLPVVHLGDLGDDDSMKAIGLFEHEGVANHPGDSGMEKMAVRIFEKIKNYL